MEKSDSSGSMKVSAKGFTMKHLDDKLFETILHAIHPQAKLHRWKQSHLNTSNSILARLNSEDEVVHTFVGHIGFNIEYSLPDDAEWEFHHKHVVLKAKPPGDETISMIANIAHSISGEFGGVFDQFRNRIGFCNTDRREIEMYKISEASVSSIQPWVYHTWVDEDQQIFVYVMENFLSEGLTHLDTVDDVSVWKEHDILDVLKDVAGMHAKYYGHPSDVPAHAAKWLHPYDLIELAPLWQVYLDHNRSIWKDDWSPEIPEILQMAITNISDVNEIISLAPKTLVHNDFNVRNLGLRAKPTDGKKRLVLYDWEVANLAPPQRDVVEFLTFILPPETDATLWQHYGNQYIGFLKTELINLHGDIPVDLLHNLQSKEFMMVFDMFVVEILLNRLSMYGLAHTVHKSSFLAKVIQSAGSYLKQVRNSYPFLAKTDA